MLEPESFANRQYIASMSRCHGREEWTREWPHHLEHQFHRLNHHLQVRRASVEAGQFEKGSRAEGRSERNQEPFDALEYGNYMHTVCSFQDQPFKPTERGSIEGDSLAISLQTRSKFDRVIIVRAAPNFVSQHVASASSE